MDSIDARDSSNFNLLQIASMNFNALRLPSIRHNKWNHPLQLVQLNILAKRVPSMQITSITSSFLSSTSINPTTLNNSSNSI